MLVLGHFLYIAVLASIALAMPYATWDPDSSQFIFVVGFIAIWRYSWGVLNWIRFHIYTKMIFPRWRKAANNLGGDGMPPHVYLLVTSFRIGTETTRRVYDSVFREAIHYNRPVTIIVSIVERADQAFIKQIFYSMNPPEHLKLVFVRIAGTGKRDALACGFRAVSKQAPDDNAVVAVIDGDSMMPEGLIARCAPMFTLMPDIGALTTDEVCEVDGKWVFREWYNMRFAQRHIFMSSVAIGRRVLTLTGRMSMFRASIVSNPDFIRMVELDWVDHWRLGRFKFLTGDDKSSWFYLLKNGIPMIYVPDVQVITIETPPDPSFFRSSLTLMRRWFGNMLRTNARAIALGPKPMGWFTWISVLDQRISMWTALTGLVAAILAAFAFTPLVLLYYFLWIAMTRYVLALSLLAARPQVSAFYPFLLYYNQIVGSFIKTVVLFRLDKQKWTRQKTVLKHQRTGFMERLAAFSSAYMHVFAFGALIAALATLMGILTPPDLNFWYYVMKG